MAIAIPDLPPLLDVEGDLDVLIWRFERLRQAGYHESAASDLAARRNVDLHLASSLIRCGCPEETALRILR